MRTRWPEADQLEWYEAKRSVASRSREWLLCKSDVAYWVDRYVQILNATDERWRPFELWPKQRDVLEAMRAQRQLVVLKARQLGLTWLALAFALHRMIFHPIATIGIFSRIEADAQELLDIRLKGMYERLPESMKEQPVMQDNKTRWQLRNGSTAMAFATTGGRGYTFSLAIVDEADFQPDLPRLLTAVEPTVDMGGRMWLISSSNKDIPESRFKAIYRVAQREDKSSVDAYYPIFLPWHARPGRTPEWYEAQKAKCLAETGALDDIGGEYPATDSEALAPRTLDKRIPAFWIEACFVPMRPSLPDDAPSLPALDVYQPPVRGSLYVIGADPAEGNPTSDDSALTVLDVMTGEECAALAGKFDPSVFAGHVAALARHYNRAGVMVERNNHGHAVLQWLRDNAQDVQRFAGRDGKPGWLSNSLGKTLMYDAAADAFRDGDTTLHSRATYTQLASIEGATLRAPDGQHDDRADSYALAHVGRAVAAKPKRVVTQYQG